MFDNDLFELSDFFQLLLWMTEKAAGLWGMEQQGAQTRSGKLLILGSNNERS